MRQAMPFRASCPSRIRTASFTPSPSTLQAWKVPSCDGPPSTRRCLPYLRLTVHRPWLVDSPGQDALRSSRSNQPAVLFLHPAPECGATVWAQELADYVFKIVHLAGNKNPTDEPSRRVDLRPEEGGSWASGSGPSGRSSRSEWEPGWLGMRDRGSGVVPLKLDAETCS
jgi:hypothetical protein